LKEEKMMRKNLLLRALLVLALLCTGVLLAQNRPVRNVSGKRHPNLAAAQRLSQQAFEKIVAAQQANEFDMGGHAQKAKALLEEANRELKEAAEAANENKK
jgi:hypothetical protein